MPKQVHQCLTEKDVQTLYSQIKKAHTKKQIQDSLSLANQFQEKAKDCNHCKALWEKVIGK
ncbi:MAG: hypothetical protein ACP5OG_02350 [Candidatus Nanoarchaeia archaeon]